MALALRALVFARVAGVAGGSSAGRIVLVEEFLECGHGLCLEFDEVVQFLVILSADGVDKFCSDFEDEIGSVIDERCDGVHVIRKAITGSLSGDFACGSFGELFHNEWAEVGESLVTLGFCFPFSDGWVEGACAFYNSLEESKAMMWISRNTYLLELLFDLVITFKFGGQILGLIPSIVHGADEFLDVDGVQSSTVGAEVV